MSTKSKEKVQMDPAYIIKLTVTLLVTCVVVAAALGGVNAVTEEKIDAINWAKTVEAMKAVVADPDNTTFSDKLTLTDEMTAASGSVTLDSVYEAQVGGATAGYAVKNAETAGIGSKVMTNMPTASGVGVLSQFEGKSAADGLLAVGTNVDAISGATVSTRGVTNGVNAALAVAGVMG